MMEIKEMKVFIFSINLISIACMASTIDALQCDRCTCVTTATFPAASTVARSILAINCSDSSGGGNGGIRLPAFDTYDNLRYDEIHAEFRRNKLVRVAKFDLKTVTRIDLAYNDIRTIDDGAFAQLTMLVELDLSHNKLDNLESNAFENLKNLERLNLYDTRIKKLEGNAFRELTSLKELDLGHNFLVGELEKDLFSYFKGLEVLSINENGLMKINIDTLSTLGQLKRLDLSGNLLEKIDEDIFVSLNELNFLDLSKNKLVFLKEDLFKNLNKLVELNLANNELSRLDNSLTLSKSLRVVNVGHNSLKDMEFLRQELDGLREIRVEFNKLKNMEFVKDFKQIEILNVSSNAISEFPLQHFPKLRVIDLSNNTLDTIPAILTAQHLPSLTTLRLDMNPIASLLFPVTPYVFTNLSYVSVSDMPELRELTATAFAALRGKDPSKRENLEQAVEGKEGGVMKREVQKDSFEKFLSEDEEDEEDEDEEGEDEVEEKPKAEEEKANKDEEHDNAEVIMSSSKTEIVEVAEIVTEKAIEYEQYEDSADEQLGGDDEEEVPNETHEIENKKTIDVPEVVSIVSETPGNMRSAPAKSADVEHQDGVTKKVSEEASEGGLQIGNLRSEPVNLKKDEVEKNDGGGGSGGGGSEMMTEVKCKGSRLVLKVRNNKNLLTIEAETFKDIDICELDLSYNSLSTVPETMVDWTAVPSIDLQGNPWDCSCRLQWLLDIIVPKLYVRQPEQLYELRCGTPAMLRDRRFVHFYNWTEPAFCSVHKERTMLEVPVEGDGGDQDEGIMLKLGGSSGMLVVVGVACGVVLLLVGAGVYLQRRLTLKRRTRNRRA